MRVTVEVSYYPLTGEFRDNIYAFIETVKKNPELSVSTTGMSTLVTGEYDELMNTISKRMKENLIERKGVFILKIASGDRTDTKAI